MMRAPVAFLLLCAAIASCSAADKLPLECDEENYEILMEQPKRALNYQNAIADVPYCDAHLPPGWYRVMHTLSGERQFEDIPNVAPKDAWFCNTEYPIYLDPAFNGGKPYPTQPGKTVLGVPLLAVTGGGGSVQLNRKVDITMCGNFRVYRIPDLPNTCNMALCFGTDVPCPGTNRYPHPTLGCADPASLAQIKDHVGGRVPEVKTKIKTGGRKLELMFQCHLDVLKTSKITKVYAQWFFHHGSKKRLVHLEGPLSRDAGVPTLYESHWTGKHKLGANVTCRLAGEYDQPNTMGDFIESKGFYAGLKLEKESIKIGVEAEVKVHVTTTVPILCHRADGRSCGIRLSLLQDPIDRASCAIKTGQIQPRIDPAIPIGDGACGPWLKGIGMSDVNEATGEPKNKDWMRPGFIEMTGRWTDTTITKGHTVIRMRYHTPDQGPPPFFKKPDYPHWRQNLPDFHVHLSDSKPINIKGKVCRSNNDPHMSSFDGARYELHKPSGGPGTYMLYRHKYLPLQIQARYEICGRGYILCNCGVAVQAGNDVFVAMNCKGPNGRRYIEKKCGNDYTTEVIRGGAFKITFSTGTYVTIPAAPRRGIFHQISVQASASDWDSTEGLCGNVNGDRSDDFTTRGGKKLPVTANYRQEPKEFSSSWKLDAGDKRDLLSQPLAVSKTFKPTAVWKGKHQLCRCEGFGPTAKVNCAFAGKDDQCAREYEQIYNQIHGRGNTGYITHCPVTSRRKRDAEESDLVEELFYAAPQFAPAPAVEEDVKRGSNGWPLGWDKARATSECRDMLYNKMQSGCKKVESVNFDGMIDDCLSDLELTGDISWAKESKKTLQSECLDAYSTNETLWVQVEVESNGTKTKQARLPEIIEDNICPNDCSGNGDCVKGNCSCSDERWEGVDCSIDRHAAPSEVAVSNSGLCDLNVRPCRRIIMYGDGFSKDVGKPVCRLQEFTLDVVNGTELVRKDRLVDAEIVNVGMAICPLITETQQRSRRAAHNSQRVVVHGYKVSVSNNQRNFSEDVTVLEADSRCLNCSAQSISCTRLPETCMIDGNCYVKGDKNPANECESCIPERSDHLWTPTGCSINGACINPGSVDPKDKCLKCDMNSSTSQYTRILNSCSFEGECVGDGMLHSVQKCLLCDISKDRMTPVIIPDTCFIDGKCYTKYEKTRKGDACFICDSDRYNNYWSYDFCT